MESIFRDDPLDQSESYASNDADAETPLVGVVQTYLVGLRETLSRQIKDRGKPVCYMEGHFWIRPQDPYFAMLKAEKSPDGLNPERLYHPRVFLWLPNLLNDNLPKCPNTECAKYKKGDLSVKGWNDKPIARRVIDLDGSYFIMTQRVECPRKKNGCGKSWNLYDVAIMEQLEPGLAAAFPAFLTHRSAIDKTVMTLIRAGMAHRLSSSAWSDILRELSIRAYDLKYLDYMHAINRAIKRLQALDLAELPTYPTYSAFGDKFGYAGSYASRWYLNTVYQDYMEHIRPILDQCISALTGYIIKWDQSFKLPKYLMKLNGVEIFVALFTLLNEFEQIRLQAFVPTKSLAHIRDSLEALVKSLEAHGLAQPAMGYTDNVASDAAFFVDCIPNLGKNIKPVQLEEFSDLPRWKIPSDVTIHTCSTEQEIQSACNSIIESVSTDESVVHLGFDMEWEFSIERSDGGPKKTALVQIAFPTLIYLLHIYSLKELPSSLCTILNSNQFVKIGRNINADLAKLSRDFPEFHYDSKIKHSEVIELGAFAKSKSVVSRASASLATITAATFGHNLSKEERESSWSGPLSEDQIHYAALDAWTPLKVWTTLKDEPTVGIPLKSASPVGQLVSIQVQSQEVARGVLVSQPRQFPVTQDALGKSIMLNISTTKTRAVIQIDEVLAPNYILSLHKKTLKELKGNQTSFEVAVNLSLLRTRSSKVATQVPAFSEPPRQLEHNLQVPQPPEDIALWIQSEASEISERVLDEHELSDDDDDNDMDESDDNVLGYTQPSSSGSVPSNIIGDVFHEEHRLSKTLSRRHSLARIFSIYLSDTLLVPDKGDRKRVESVLAKQNLKWDQVRKSSSEWLFRRVRRYLPEKSILHKILEEMFQCWGPIICPVSKLPLFDNTAWKIANSILLHVKKGWVADLDGIPLYTIEGHDKHGLPIYHSLRGTSSIEGGVHNPIKRNFASLNASPQLADCLLADFRHRHNIDVGVKHKRGLKYIGHYDPWLDHEISKLCADISWKSKPPERHMFYDTDPLSFAQTEEQFGILAIPANLRITSNLTGASVVTPPQERELSLQVANIYPTELRLSRLRETRGNAYEYLAAAQKTLYAVTPIHTKEEFQLFHKALSIGEEWATFQTHPNFEKMAAWWSSQADGKNVLYKLPEHLSKHFQKWNAHRQTREALVASEPL